MLLGDFALEPSENCKSVLLTLSIQTCVAQSFFYFFCLIPTTSILFWKSFNGECNWCNNSFLKICSLWLILPAQVTHKDQTTTCGLSNVEDDIKTFWGSIYKPALTKKVGDLQWWVLHTLFQYWIQVCKINALFVLTEKQSFTVSLHCERLRSHFVLMETIFLLIRCSQWLFIFGFKYCKNKKRKGQLLNFILGLAKLAIYISRRCEILYDSDCSWRAHKRKDKTLHLSMKKVEHFEDICSVENMLFWVYVLSFSEIYRIFFFFFL